MHLLRLGGLKMRRNSNGGVGFEGMGGFTSSEYSDKQEKLGAIDGVNFAKKTVPKTSTTSSSLSHSTTNKFFIYAVAVVVIIFAFSSYVDM